MWEWVRERFTIFILKYPYFHEFMEKWKNYAIHLHTHTIHTHPQKDIIYIKINNIIIKNFAGKTEKAEKNFSFYGKSFFFFFLLFWHPFLISKKISVSSCSYSFFQCCFFTIMEFSSFFFMYLCWRISFYAMNTYIL